MFSRERPLRESAASQSAEPKCWEHHKLHVMALFTQMLSEHFEIIIMGNIQLCVDYMLMSFLWVNAPVIKLMKYLRIWKCLVLPRFSSFFSKVLVVNYNIPSYIAPRLWVKCWGEDFYDRYCRRSVWTSSETLSLETETYTEQCFKPMLIESEYIQFN